MALFNQFKIVLIGIAMGAADIIPGISGGTVAFTTGIYVRLIHSLSCLDLHAWRYLYKRQFSHLFRYMDLGFLLKLGSGIVISLFSMVHVITYWLAHYPVMLWSLFLGLILASAWIIGRHIAHWNVRQVLFLVLGFVFAWQVSAGMRFSIEPGLLSFFLGGCIAISAMLLPGISGSFLLLLMGLYEPILMALKNLHFYVLLTFGSGCMLGLFCFSKVIHWLLKHYLQTTQAFLLGLTLGALRKVWPWQVPFSSSDQADAVGHHLLMNVLPSTFEHMTGESAQIWLACLLFFMAFMSILLLARLTKESDGSLGKSKQISKINAKASA